ncbi:MAG: urease accessory protein UreD [Burkholderiaceae bacterium]
MDRRPGTRAAPAVPATAGHSEREHEARHGDRERLAGTARIPAPGPIAPIGGWDAELILRFRHDARAKVTRIAVNRHRGPLRLLKPLTSDDGRRLEAVIIHPPGGLVAGDTLRIAAVAEDGSCVLLTTPGAQKWYRPRAAAAARVATSLALEAGAALDWLPQPSILFDGARAMQSLAIAMSAASSHVGWELLVRGRDAMGERWQRGAIDQTLSIAVDGRLWWRQRLAADASDRLFSSPLGWRGRIVGASVWCCAPHWPRERITAVRDRWCELIDGAALVGGATVPTSGLVLAQLLGDEVESLHATSKAMWRSARTLPESGTAVSDPRIWRT